jgi:DNA-binding CsgD family transcriptional regulator
MKKEQEILALHKQGLIQREIASRVGVNQTHVSDVLQRNGLAPGKGNSPGKSTGTKYIVLDLFLQGMSPEQIAEQLNLCRTYVGMILKTQGHPIPRNVKTKYDLPMEEIANRYRAGESCSEIAKDYGIPPERIRRRLRDEGVPRRPATIAVPKGKKNIFYKNGQNHLRGEDKDMHYYRRQSYEVAAICLGQPIPRGYVIHHLDENWHNNDPINLVLFPSQSLHTRFHMQLLRLQRAGTAVDATQLALESGATRLPSPPRPILF